MLVFLSDVHFTDGSSGETIHPGAFRGFVQDIRRLAEDAQARELEICLVGDIFDVIRSDKWLSERAEGIRPWDKRGKEQEGLVEDITKAICGNQQNAESLSHLRSLKDLEIGGTRIPVRFRYLIGNHDWLINRYPSCREVIQQALGLEGFAAESQRFEEEHVWEPEYKVLARHGDRYDILNYEGNRDASSLGDAVVIELVNRFPKEVEKELELSREHDLVRELREIDNVRPLLEISSWIVGVLRRVSDAEMARKVKEVWNRLAEKFFKIPFVKKKDIPFWPDVIDGLQIAFRISTASAFSEIDDLIHALPEKLISLFSRDSYPKHAYRESPVKAHRCQYVVYGHTHDQVVIPLDIVPVAGGAMHRIYFNTGTWRKTHTRTAFDRENREFIGWHVLTHISFYRSDEARGRQQFEVWNGALGVRS